MTRQAQRFEEFDVAQILASELHMMRSRVRFLVATPPAGVDEFASKAVDLHSKSLPDFDSTLVLAIQDRALIADRLDSET